MTNNLRSSVIWSAVRNWGTRLGSVAVFLVLARILDKEQLGLFSATIAITAIAELFADNGLGDAVVQAPEVDDPLLTAALLVNIGLGVVLAAGLLLGAGRLEAWFAAPGLAPLLSVMMISLLLNAANYVPQSIYRRRFEYRWLAMRALVAMGISGAIGIAMAFMGFGAWSMVIQAVLFAFINFAIIWIRPPFNPLVRPAFNRASTLLRFSASILGGRLLYYICTRGIELVTLYRFGTAALSLYIIGSRIYFVATQLLTQVLVDVAFSSFSRLASDREELDRAFFYTLRTATVVTAPIFLGLAAIAPELCHVAFGGKGPEAAPYLFFVATFGTLQVAQFFFGSVLSALGRPAVATGVMATQAAISTAILLPPWPIGSVTLVALNSGTLLLIAPVYLVACSRFGGFSIRRILRTVYPPYVAGALMLAAVWAIRPALIPYLPSPLFRGMGLTLTGAAIFLSTMALLAPATLRAALDLRRRAPKVPSPAE